MDQSSVCQYDVSSACADRSALVSAPPSGNPYGSVSAPWILCGSPQPDATPVEVRIVSSPFSIGRHSGNCLCLANATVSGYHAELSRTDQGVVLKDLNSTNGTFVNGRRLRGTALLCAGDVLQFGTAVFEIYSDRHAPQSMTVAADVAASALAHLQFERLLDEPAVVPFFQPFVRLQDSTCVGYEVLARSRLIGLESPTSMFRMAYARDLHRELSALVRWLGVSQGRQLRSQLFLNTHPAEIGDPRLVESLVRLRQAFPQEAIVLEIHEAAMTSPHEFERLRAQLNELVIGLAYDDFGAGQARLRDLVAVPPDVIKFDMCLIQGIPNASVESQRMLSSLVRAVQELHVTVLAEGVETAEEAACCREMGFDLAQGYFFGRPAALWQAECRAGKALGEEPAMSGPPHRGTSGADSEKDRRGR